MKSKNQNQKTKQKQTYKYREQTDGCQMERELRSYVKKVKGLRSTNWQLQKSHGDVEYSTGNRVNNTVITLDSASEDQTNQEDHVVSYVNV